ncbi:hypothetical protein CU100_05375 [Phyllobacterium endophyticum]|uniref:Uncharacterized protein n=1 Tax=Phyllobacterium endophyticum TaxID=1149773 RepID=A0A2P7B0Z0_9HYPH|nr:hypothetical protein CU100_05375 [Phyllobacterium endophyticum]
MVDAAEAAVSPIAGSFEGVARWVKDLGGGTKCVSLAGDGPAGAVAFGAVVQPEIINSDRVTMDRANRIRLSFCIDCASREQPLNDSQR